MSVSAVVLVLVPYQPYSYHWPPIRDDARLAKLFSPRKHFILVWEVRYYVRCVRRRREHRQA
jgi:hypothetical protein